MGLRSLYHRLLGRSELCQIYANVTHTTPESCLEHHGEIVTGEEVPEVEGCDFEVLTFPVGKLGDYREKRNRMEKMAERELRRRELLKQGREKLESGDIDAALEAIERSAKIDLFIPEVEELGEEFGSSLSSDEKKELKDLLILNYKEKFGQKRYERLPERMREDRKEAGLERIRELFG